MDRMARSADIDCLIIGAGVVGLAIARQLALGGRETLVLEANKSIGQGISSRNSEVIHAGIYYPKDSLKAQFCLAGRKALYEFCQSHKIPHQRCGKLLVAASPDQRDQVLAIQAKAKANGVDDLTLIDRASLKAMEPEVEGAPVLADAADVVGAIAADAAGDSAEHRVRAGIETGVHRACVRRVCDVVDGDRGGHGGVAAGDCERAAVVEGLVSRGGGEAAEKVEAC